MKRLEECKAWLKEYLQNNGGFRLVEDVRSARKQLGFTKAELKQARQELGVKLHHDKVDANTENLFWTL